MDQQIRDAERRYKKGEIAHEALAALWCRRGIHNTEDRLVVKKIPVKALQVPGGAPVVRIELQHHRELFCTRCEAVLDSTYLDFLGLEGDI